MNWSRTSATKQRIRSLVMVVVAVLLTVVSTGCLTGDVELKVEKDGSGEVDIVIFPSDELQALLAGGNLIPVIKDSVGQVRGSSFEQVSEKGRIGYRVSLPFDDYEELGRTVVNGTVVGETHVRLFSTFELTELKDEWRLKAVLAPEMLSDALKAAPSTQQLVDSEGLMPLNSDLRLTISLPGKISRTNGTQVGSGSAVWALKTNTDVELQMVTVPKPLLTDTQKVFVGIGFAIVVGIFLVLFGSRRSWGKGTQRRERRRVKGMTFAGPSGAGPGWQNQGPIDHAPEGTIPKSGPMPPRAIPTLEQGVSTGSPFKSEPRLPNGELAPVGPPIAPTVDPNVPNPFAPHKPGAVLPGAPAAKPVEEPAFATNPRVTEAAPLSPADSETVQSSTPPHLSTERQPAHLDVSNEGSGRYDHRDPVDQSSAASVGVESPAPGSAPWWFEREADSGESHESVPPEPAWAARDSDEPVDAGQSPFSMGANEDDGSETSASHYVAAGGGFFDYVDDGLGSASPDSVGGIPSAEPVSVVESVEQDIHSDLEPIVTAPKSGDLPVPQPKESSGEAGVPEYSDALAELISEVTSESGADSSGSVEGAGHYPSIDGSGGLEEGVGVDLPVDEEQDEYPSIDGSGDLGIDVLGEPEIPADWYPDPDDPDRFRWWDGVGWTDFVSDSGS